MSVKGTVLIGYSLAVGSLMLYSRTAAMMGLGILIIAMAAAAVVSALTRQRRRSA